MESKHARYKKHDIVEITDPLTPYEGRLGVIIEASNTKMRYKIKLDDGFQDSFSWNQIMHNRPKEMLESLIDLSLTMGPAGLELFEEWVMELKLRFP